MKSADLKKIVSRVIAPKLRELGWKGSGFQYKRFHDNSPIIDVIGFQVSNYGGSFCVETGVHLKYLKERWEGEYDLKKLTHASLTIRKRMVPNEENDYWWEIGADEDSTSKVLDGFWKVFLKKGTDYFDYFMNFPEPFSLIKTENNEPKLPAHFEYYLPGITDARLNWLLAQTFDYTKEKEKACTFAELALKVIRKKNYGSALQEDLEEIIKRNTV